MDGSTMPQDTSLYALRDVSRVYRVGGSEVRAVDHVDLSIESGEFVAIEGASGSGKSTLLQLLGALDVASGGSLRFEGAELTEMNDTALTALRSREIGFVFQSFNLIPTLTAAENVEAVMVPLGGSTSERATRVRASLEEVGLAERATHLPSKLSGGEQQRVAIARALANRPRVILADEPTGNLDSATSEEIMDVLSGLSTDGVTVVVVTHAHEVARRATRRLKMKDGRFRDD